MSDPATRFYTEIPVFDDFSKVVDDRVYRRMPCRFNEPRARADQPAPSV
jgi:hypothetical protein